MTRKELEEKIQALVDGTIEDSEFEALEEVLKNDEAARVFYRQSMETEILLTELISQSMPQRMAAEIVSWPVIKKRTSRFPNSFFAIAAVLLAIAIATPLLLPLLSAPSMVANSTSGTEWLVNGDNNKSKSSGTEIKEGSIIEVVTGSINLRLPSGVEMVMNGPAKASFASLHKPILQKGSLWVNSNTSLEPVEIRTPGLLVRDIGTRFGVRIRPDGNTEVHMAEGLVEVESAVSNKTLATLKPSGNGVMISMNGELTTVPLENDPFAEPSKSEHGFDDYSYTIRNQVPAGYWRLNINNSAVKVMENEIHADMPAKHYLHSFPAEPGPNRMNGFLGLKKANQSMRFKSGKNATGLFDLNIPDGVSKNSGALSFWVRKSPGSKHEETLWALTAKPEDKSKRIKSYIILSQINQSGNLVTSLKTGGLNSSVLSSVSIADDKWHHVAYIWDGGLVEHFIDGRSMGGISSGVKGSSADRAYQIRLAVTGTDHDSTSKPFDGWLDEVAIWDRELSAEEIRAQYDAALTRGK
jgi:hypothetical protein